MSRFVPSRRAVLPLAALATVVGLAGCGSPDVTRSRLEASLAPTFSNLYVEQAGLLGHAGVTRASVHASASCDKGGPKVADVGPGADWICMVHWRDDAGAEQDGKFELQARSNACWTAAGPSKLVGLLTITDTRGHEVTNPVFEFDGCFDPSA
jgi:hypothetical protein